MACRACGETLDAALQRLWDSFAELLDGGRELRKLTAGEQEVSDRDPARTPYSEEPDWEDLASRIETLGGYVSEFCPGLALACVEASVEKGQRLLHRACCGGDAELALARKEVDEDHAGAVSSITWALMALAVEMKQGFRDGTFVLYGPGAERPLMLLLPHLHARKSSHFRGSSLPIEEEDAAAFAALGGPRCKEELLGRDHFGADAGGLPAGHQHVVMGRISMPDGTRGIYLKPEQHGCGEDFGQTVLHGVDYFSSQWQRYLGDRRSHDEGAHRRKEYPLGATLQRFDEVQKELDDLARAARQGRSSSVSEMVRTLQEQKQGVEAWGRQADDVLRDWSEQYRPPLAMRRGNEVLISTDSLLSAADSGS